MPAIDTIASFQTTSGASLAAGVMATGDSASIRSFPSSAKAHIVAAFYDDVTAPAAARVRSAYFHDNVRGLQFTPGATTPIQLLPPTAPQELHPSETLTFELSAAASTGKALLALLNYYDQLPGADARLHMPGDVLGMIRSIKPVYVAIGSGANTAGQWYDLVLTTTESILKADTDYAVLGLVFDQAVAALAIKGSDTANLRVGCPGGTAHPHSSDYFLWLSDQLQKPCVPVINANNAGSTYVSLISSAATGAAGTFQVILAELNSRLG